MSLHFLFGRMPGFHRSGSPLHSLFNPNIRQKTRRISISNNYEHLLNLYLFGCKDNNISHKYTRNGIKTLKAGCPPCLYGCISAGVRHLRSRCFHSAYIPPCSADAAHGVTEMRPLRGQYEEPTVGGRKGSTIGGRMEPMVGGRMEPTVGGRMEPTVGERKETNGRRAKGNQWSADEREPMVGGRKGTNGRWANGTNGRWANGSNGRRLKRTNGRRPQGKPKPMVAP